MIEGPLRRDVNALLANHVGEGVEATTHFHAQCDMKPPPLCLELALERFQADEHDHDQRGGAARIDVGACSDRRANRSHHPDRRRGGQPDNGALSMEDGARADKTDAGYDLGRDAGRVAVGVTIR